MGRKPGRRSKNRKPKPATVVEGGLGPAVPAREDKYITIDRPPLCFVYKITGTQRNYFQNTVTANLIQLEDTIRPVQLKFPAPMKDVASDPKGFVYHWERLTYLFELDDPATFPSLRSQLDKQELEVAERFYQTCKNLAGYSILSSNGGISATSDGVDWIVKSDLPSHEAFAGFSATFRQIHNHMENASFVKVWNILCKAAGALEDEQMADVRALLKCWKKARARLMEKMAATMVCERLQENVRADAPKSFMGINPEEVIQTHNYGDSLHWGEQRERLATLTNDPENVNFHKHACVTAMMQLSHFYFGFAELVASALGYARVVSSG